MATQQNITWAFDSKFGEWRCNRLATVCIIEFSGGYCVETPAAPASPAPPWRRPRASSRRTSSEPPGLAPHTNV